MATNRSFQDMLNEFLPNELLEAELAKRDWLLNTVDKDNTWKGGNLIVPFEGATASSFSFGSLAASNDIAEDEFVRGTVNSQPEVWGSMIFNHRDLMEHNTVSEQNFLKVLPNRINKFMDFAKCTASTNLLAGPHLALVTADGLVGGTIGVNRPDRFMRGQKIQIVDNNTAAVTGYVSAINVNTKLITVVTARGGVTAVDLSAYTVAQNAKIFNEGLDLSAYPVVGNAMTSLRSSLLSAANGGSASLYGVSKVTYPFLQAYNVSGSSVTASNILEKIFDAFVEIKQHGKGMPNKCIVSYKNFGSIMKVVEASKGAFNVVPKSTDAAVYPFDTITIGSVTGQIVEIIAVHEADDDVIMFLDMRAMTFYSNGFFKKRIAPDGKEYFEVRNTSGYQYIIDICLFGDLVLKIPAYCGIIHSISY
jgi:hypothetical protein